MKKQLLCTLMLATLLGCQQDQEASQPEAQPLRSGIDIDNMDTAVRPGDDFFSYVNGGWVAEVEIPADKSSYGAFSVLHDQSQEDVRSIIEASASGDFADGSDEQKVGDLYQSWLDMETRNTLGLAPLKKEWARIDAISDHGELAVYMAAANRRGYNMPFVLAQFVDFKNPDSYMMYTWQGGLGLPDREYYFNEDARSAEIRDLYLAHIESMLQLAEVTASGAAAGMIMALEARMAAVHMLKEETRDRVKLYNKLTLAELKQLMPRFNWDGYAAEAGVQDIDGLVVTMLDHMQALDAIIAETSLEDWKSYLKWTTLNSVAGRLNETLDEQNFAFYGTVLAGREEQRPQWRRGVSTVNATLGEVVGKVYVKEHFPPEAKQRMLELVENLVRAYGKSISELEWMTDTTREQALEKLSKFTPKIGYPDQWRDYSALEIKPDDLFGNLERASLVEYERKLARQGGKVDRAEWSIMPQTVNAYYNPPLNEIVFPAAILQPPFFDMQADDAVNYGAIGAVIGHEIGHGFDDSGSAFDGDGVLRNWWTDEDRAEFETRASVLVDQYSAFQPFEDLHVNGEFTLGENIGDLGGISIGLLAYQMSLDGEEPPELDGFTGYQRVFLGFAQIWRTKTREEALRQLIMTDSHAPPVYRTNGAVRNVDEFYRAFDVVEADALYLPPADRVKIW
ncbi:MAG: M13-type metalloendopeptidase [Halieaceae bacterium]